MFRGSAVVQHGWLTAEELCTAAWQRLHRDVYCCATVEVTHAVQARAAAVAVRGPGSAELPAIDLAGRLGRSDGVVLVGQLVAAGWPTWTGSGSSRQRSPAASPRGPGTRSA